MNIVKTHYRCRWPKRPFAAFRELVFPGWKCFGIPLVHATLFAIGLGLAWQPPVKAQLSDVTPERLAEFNAERAKSVLELQPYRRIQSVSGSSGQRLVTLIDLHPGANAWYLLVLGEGSDAQVFHIENSAPRSQRLRLDAEHAGSLKIISADSSSTCPLWGEGGASALSKAAGDKAAYVSLCNDRVFLRRASKGHRTRLEQFTELLRDNVWKGEQIITTTRELLLQDREIERNRISAGQGATTAVPGRSGPLAAQIAPEFESSVITGSRLAIRPDILPGTSPTPGRWYPVAGREGIHLSLIEPHAVPKSVLNTHSAQLGAMDPAERAALVYLLAIDLERYELKFEMGADHPRLGWSGRTLPQARNDSLPGPDGIDSSKPLVLTGKVPPHERARVVATFAGGFKRSHGAFKYGKLALRKGGSHYGFVQQGVVLSKPRPDLATIIIGLDGLLDMTTWADDKLARLGSIRDLRQNGVALVEPGADGVPVPGALVSKWGEGNWSGSHDSKLRTMRAGACLQDSPSGRFLIFAVFTSATPVAMARVFQAYSCRYGMLLDMNAFEHTYAAIYPPDGAIQPVQHLIDGMAEADLVVSGRAQARFIDYSDNRDFFYVVPRR